MAVTSSSGLASGIDTKAIVDALIASDGASTKKLQENRDTTQTRLTAIQGLNTALLRAQTSLDKIRDSATWTATTATSSDTTKLDVTGSATATAGTYQISILSVATAQQLVTGGAASPLASNTADNGVGSLTIQVGSGAETTLNFDTSNSSLNGIASAVNSAKLGVTASVVNDGSGYRLVIQANSTGTDNAVTKFNGSGDLATLFPTDGGGHTALRELAAAKNASLRIGDPLTGLTVSKPTNVITDVIPGVTLTAKNEGSSITVKVATDSSGTKTAIKQFITDYNSALTYMKQNASFDATTGKGGVLLADSDLRSGLDRITSALLGTVDGQPDGFGSLTAVGVSIDRATGALTLNEATFDLENAENPSAVKSLFQAASNNAKTQMVAMDDSTQGSIYFKTDGLKTSLSTMDTQITKANAWLEQRRATYQAKFLQMEKLIQGFNSQGTSLTNFITGLNKSNG
ncbi:MAG TPA: flagellar filament capping protein FliD [Planctomycetota bacterium]|jgi:flagellar hook-associated protein 2|nr:flagellar filament capping protein FliD [Planctomycetota bacterium]